MDYKDLFRKIALLLSSPSRFWGETDGMCSRNVQMDFVYPLIGLCGLAEFAGTFIHYDGAAGELFQWALMRCCAVAVALFGGFFLAAYLVERICGRWMPKNVSRSDIQTFVGYSMVVIFVLDIVCSFYSILILQWILQLYTILIVFEGARRFLKVDEEKLTLYTVAASVVILLSPALIEFIFNKLTVILN